MIELRSSSANEGGVAKAVEALRQATLGQHRGQLEGLGVMTREATVKALTLSDHVIAAVGANAMIFFNREREHPLRGHRWPWDRRSVHLSWPVRPGEAQSPLGPLVAEARAEGYPGQGGRRPVPYHGYLYRMLFAQGPDAPGAAYEFGHKRHMIGGFALVAFPAEYENSGIMTFIVSHDDVVYEKDLGPKTAQVVGGMKTFNPDQTWRKAEPDATKRSNRAIRLFRRHLLEARQMLGKILTGRVTFTPSALCAEWEVEYAAECSLGRLVSGTLGPKALVAPTGFAT